MTRRNTALFLFFFFASLAHGQNVNDAGMWNAFSFSADINDLTPWKDGEFFKTTAIRFSPEFRFNENISQLSGYFADFGIDKKWSKYISTTAEYRLGAKRDNEFFSARKRWSLGLQLVLPVKEFKITSTTRYQIAQVGSTDLDLNSTWRQKVSLEYSGWKNYGLQLSHEQFFLPITLENTNWRSQLTLKYKLDKSNAISLGYLVQRDLSNADMDFIILTGYKWEFSKKRDKGIDLK
jgi:hypothetical protein